MRVTLVDVTDSGDLLLCLDGRFIAGADRQAGDDAWIIQEAAANLAKQFGVEVDTVRCQAAGLPEDWAYADIVTRAFPEQGA